MADSPPQVSPSARTAPNRPCSAADAPARRVLSRGRVALYRHPALVRATHWINVLCLLVLLLSGLQILNAHPALYLGDISQFKHPFIALPTIPGWLTVPPWQDLAAGRRWHFFFAWLFVFNGAAYALYALASGRVRRTLWPTREQLRHIGGSALDHLLLRFPRAEQAKLYYVLQTLSYLVVMFGLLPLMILTGVTMSPAVDARLHFLTSLFGGRQTDRTIHFFTAMAIVLFFLIHIAAVAAAGPLASLRSMVSGWFVYKPRRKTS